MHAPFLVFSLLFGIARADTPVSQHDATRTTLNVWGAPGFQAVVEPVPVRAGTFSLSFQGRYGRAAGFLTASDAAALFAQEGHFLWSPLAALDVGLGFVATHVADAGIPGDGASLIGAPVLHLRWNDGHPWPLRWGAVLEVAPPVAGSTLRVQDAAFAVSALAGWRTAEAWRFALNAGFVYDRSSDALGAPVSISQHFANGLTLGNRFVGGLAGSWQARTASGVWEPFAELTGQLAATDSTPAGVGLLSVGGKWLPPRWAGLQLTAGVDVRLAGAPGGDSIFPGTMPWTLYGRASITTDTDAPELPVALAPCPPPTIAACPPSPNTLLGTLRDAAGLPIKNAVIAINATRGESVAYDSETGDFRIQRFVCGPEQLVDVAVSVPGATEEKFHVDCDTWLSDPNRPLNLRYSGQQAPSALICYVRDRITGKLVTNAHVSLAHTRVPVKKTGRQGLAAFEKLEPGLYRLVVRAPEHVPQERVVNVGDASVVIVNVDLEPF